MVVPRPPMAMGTKRERIERDNAWCCIQVIRSYRTQTGSGGKLEEVIIQFRENISSFPAKEGMDLLNLDFMRLLPFSIRRIFLSEREGRKSIFQHGIGVVKSKLVAF